MNVLIVDDSATMRKIIMRTIRQSGYSVDNVLEAGNGKEALEVIKDNKVDLVLTDINMPEMDGISFIEVLRALPETKNLPVLIISTEGAEDVVEKAKTLGVKGFVRKPFTPEKIGQALKQAAG